MPLRRLRGFRFDASSAAGGYRVFGQVNSEGLDHARVRRKAARVWSRKISSHDLGLADCEAQKPEVVLVVALEREPISEGQWLCRVGIGSVDLLQFSQVCISAGAGHDVRNLQL